MVINHVYMTPSSLYVGASAALNPNQHTMDATEAEGTQVGPPQETVSLQRDRR